MGRPEREGDEFEWDDDFETPSGLRRSAHAAWQAAGWLSGLPLHLLLVVAGAVAAFAHGWLASRPRIVILRGLPFVLATAAWGLVMLRIVGVSDSNLLVRYDRLAAQAAEEGNVPAAMLWLEKASLLNHGDPSYVYRQALLVDEAGRREDARALLRRIAPADAEGYPEAHFWLAGDLIDRNLPLTPELSRTIEHHLQQALRSGPLASEGHARLGQLLVLRGDRAGAIVHFELAAREKPDCQLNLAVLYQAQAEPVQAARAAGLAAAHFRKLAGAEPTVWGHRLGWAQAELLRQQYAAAVAVLQPAVEGAEDARPFRELLVAVYLSWLADLAEREPDRLDKQLEVLDAAFQAAPDHPEVLTAIANAVTQAEDDHESPRFAELHRALQRTLASGNAPAMVHLLVGTRSLQAGDLEGAIVQLELALQANPHLPLVLNNLAWALAHREPPDLERALRLIDTAVPLSDHPCLRGTRAVILAAMGRSAEAIRELEDVLRRHPEPAWVHGILADLYRQAGVEDLAELHRQLAAPVARKPTS